MFRQPVIFECSTHDFFTHDEVNVLADVAVAVGLLRVERNRGLLRHEDAGVGLVGRAKILIGHHAEYESANKAERDGLPDRERETDDVDRASGLGRVIPQWSEIDIRFGRCFRTLQGIIPARSFVAVGSSSPMAT